MPKYNPDMFHDIQAQHSLLMPGFHRAYKHTSACEQLRETSSIYTGSLTVLFLSASVTQTHDRAASKNIHSVMVFYTQTKQLSCIHKQYIQTHTHTHTHIHPERGHIHTDLELPPTL